MSIRLVRGKKIAQPVRAVNGGQAEDCPPYCLGAGAGFIVVDPCGAVEVHCGVRFQKFSIILGLIVMVVCDFEGQTPSGGESGIEGVITISPAKPGPIRADAPDSVPVANATFVVENDKGTAASFTTDENGHFRALVPPGHYKVSLRGRKSTIGHFGPFDVDVAAGKMTNVQWKCDSGIR